jgi:DNA-binding CsgD family transcriptional regulator
MRSESDRRLEPASTDAVPGHEVSGRVVRALGRTLGERGVDLSRLFAGLSFSLGDIERPGRRAAWDEFAVLMERAEEAVGGPVEFQDLCAAMISRQRSLHVLAGLVVSPRDLYLLSTTICRSAYRILAQRVDVLADEHIRIECSIPREYRDCPAFFRATTGVLRVLPRFVGARDAVVESEIGVRHAIHHVLPPPSGTVVARFSRALDDSLGRVVGGLDLATIVDLASDGLAVEHFAEHVGQRLAAHVSLEELAEDVLRVASEYLLCHRAALWVRRSNGGPLALVGSFEPGSTAGDVIACEFSLGAGGEAVGRLEIDLPSGNREEQRRLARTLLPWIALGIMSSTRPEARDADPLARAAARAAEWKLTPAEQRVLELVLRGLTNHEIGQALGCSPRTAEAHVSRVLRKSGHSSRIALIARA